MANPESFTVTTDFPTLKNDGLGDTTITIPASVNIAGNGYAEYTSDVVAGASGAIQSSRIASSKDSNRWYQAQVVVLDRTGVNGGFSAPYSVAFFIRRLSATTLRCEVLIPNPYGTTLTTEAGVETISYHINTFIPPY